MDLLKFASIILYFLTDFVYSQEHEVINGIAGSDVIVPCSYPADKVYDSIKFELIWTNEDGEILCTSAGCYHPRMANEHIEQENQFELTIKDTNLDDSGLYKCFIGFPEENTRSIKYIQLVINRTPTLEATVNGVTPLADEVNTVASCVARGAKPQPDIWYADKNGKRVETQSELEIATSPEDDRLVDVTLDLKMLFTKALNGEKYYCVVKHITFLEDDKGKNVALPAIAVHYAPTVTIRDVEATQISDRGYIAEEGATFFADCFPEGNPAPNVTWRFIADDVNYTLPEGHLLPESFYQDKTRLISNSLMVPDETTTNNGTFICELKNSVGSVEAEFDLGVYVAPTTTPAPTTPANKRESSAPLLHSDYTVNMEPRQAGADAALIGGIVAVVCFIIIVFLILMIRYFCSHKATYHTNEAKATNDFEAMPPPEKEDLDNDSDVLEADEELLQDKRRPEYFM